MKPLALLIVAGAALVLFGGGAVVYGKTRGLRNNNPGNIRRGQSWKGLADIQKDPEYATFRGIEWGIRAMSKTLDTYRDRYGINTVRGIISRWAPPKGDSNGAAPGGEYTQDTESYINHVARVVGVGPDEPLQPGHRVDLIAAIVKHENGVQPLPRGLIEYGVSLA